MKSSLDVARYYVSLAELRERVRTDTDEGVWIHTAIEQALRECVLELLKLHQIERRRR